MGGLETSKHLSCHQKKIIKNKRENYRPISLLLIVSKVMERCIFTALRDHVFNLISACQHGFIAGRSCVTQLVEVLDQIGTKLDRGGQVDIIYLDLSKALYTSVWCWGNLLTRLESYLHNRYLGVTILGATSSPLPVTSQVPQGSILKASCCSFCMSSLCQML